MFIPSYNTLNNLAQTYNVDPLNIENENLTTQGAINFIQDVQKRT